MCVCARACVRVRVRARARVRACACVRVCVRSHKYMSYHHTDAAEYGAAVWHARKADRLMAVRRALVAVPCGCRL